MATKTNELHAPAGFLPLSDSGALARHASLVLWMVAALLIVGTLVDLGILWTLQRQPGPQWEFVAVVNTLEAFPRLILALATGYVGLVLGRRVGVGVRVLALALLTVGLAGAGLAAILAADYLALHRMVAPEALLAFRSTVVRGLALGALYSLLIPVAIGGWRVGRATNRHA